MLTPLTTARLRLCAIMLYVLIDRLVQRHTDTRRSLNDVEELAKRNREEPYYHNRLMGERDKPVEPSTPPGRGGSERESRHGNGEQEYQWHEIETEALNSEKTRIRDTSPQCKEQPDH